MPISKLARRYQELFHQTPRAALIDQVARDIFEARLARLYWRDLRPTYPVSLTVVEIAEFSEAAVAIFSSARRRRVVVGSALYEFYANLTGTQFIAYERDVRRALQERIERAICHAQSRDIVGRMRAEHEARACAAAG